MPLPKKLDAAIYERQAIICKAFAHPTRIQMLDLLGHGECGVGELQKRLRVSKTNLSQHLAILKSAGVVNARREGKKVFCSLAIPEVKTACSLIREVLKSQLRQNRRLAGQ